MKTGCLRRLLASLQQSPESPNYTGVGSLIQHCTDHRLLRPGRQLHGRLILLDVRPANYLGSKLITFYAKSGDVGCARQVFDRLPQRNLFTWNAMLIGYSLHDCHREALLLFCSLLCSGLRPDNYTITCLLKACFSSYVDVGQFSAGIHSYVLRNGFDSDIFVLNGLVTAYARMGDLVAARRVFDGMPERDVVSWNAIIGAYAQSGRYEESLKLYDEMGVAGVQPDEVTVVSALQACANLQDLRRGMSIQEEISKGGIAMDTAVWNSLITLYAKCGDLNYAQKLLDEMPKRDPVSWGSIISGYMQYGYCRKAMEIFQTMKNRGENEQPSLSTWNAMIAGLVQNGYHGEVPRMVRDMQLARFRPNSVTISSILPTCSYFSASRTGKEIHAHAIRNSHDQNAYVATALIDMYAKAGSLEEARRTFGWTMVKSAFVWTSIIASYAAHGHAETCFALFREMVDTGTNPDSITLTSVLTACSRAGLISEAQWVFEGMFTSYGISPTAEHRACMVDAYGRAGMLEEAIQFIGRAQEEANPRVWGALLGAALIHNNTAIGEFAANRLFELEPENEGNYILLANIYAQAGKWKDAKIVREMMKEKGLKKSPGCSWIEINKERRRFVVGDKWNAQTEGTCEVSENLLGEMRQACYCSSEEELAVERIECT
ncbi:pentatricopeptide repeat-containing protein At2g37310-like [Nymphaea colorata]|uniref:Pentacotripeptide-repeat region of PRORP domain-containing protein n=1 Tax=Nymphaea colorata TaxID=210225 RepID=A0A5K0Y1N2_9MAGN|nr:pentatricopeptide repeat-containing protein At2g37310-like [Nymphaea colorata]